MPSGVPVLMPRGFTSAARASHAFGASWSLKWPASGVGHSGGDEDALAAMRRTDIGSAKHFPSRIIPERGKVPENVGHAHGKVPCDVFKEAVAWSKQANGARDVGPEMALVGDSSSLAGVTEWLAWVACDDDVGGGGLRADELDIRYAPIRIRPVDREHSAAILVLLYLPVDAAVDADGSQCGLDPKLQTADARAE